jgi:hypothetical protein
MKVVGRILLIFLLVESLALPAFFLAIKHYQLESETAQWIVSMWPQPDVALEDKRAVADMLVSYGELAAENMLAYTALAWCAVLIYWRFFRRAPRGKDPESIQSDSLRSG